jgi:hypothetical protein
VTRREMYRRDWRNVRRVRLGLVPDEQEFSESSALDWALVAVVAAVHDVARLGARSANGRGATTTWRRRLSALSRLGEALSASAEGDDRLLVRFHNSFGGRQWRDVMPDVRYDDQGDDA